MCGFARFFCKLFFLFFLTISTLVTESADAYIFSEHMYGRAKIFGAYDLQSSSIKDVGGSSLQSYGKVNHALFVGAGYNVYFNVFDTVHPFVGIEMATRVIGTKSVYKEEPFHDLKAEKYYKELFYTHLKAGAKIIVDDKISVTPYGMIGFNVDEIVTKVENLTSSAKYMNLSAGFGGECALYDRFYVGLEYRYTTTNAGNYVRVNNHNIMMKFGFEFL